MDDDLTDSALLALVAGDELDPRVLAAWVGLRLSVPIDIDAATDAIAAMLRDTKWHIGRSIRRLETARLLVNGGTTEIGIRWLQSVAANAVKSNSAKSRKGRK